MKSYATRVDTLPGVLLRAQGGRRSKDFQVLNQQTNKQTNPEKMRFAGFYFEPRAGGEVRIFGFYTNKQTNKQERK